MIRSVQNPRKKWSGEEKCVRFATSKEPWKIFKCINWLISCAGMALHNTRHISKAYREHKHVPPHCAQQSQPKLLYNWKLWCDTLVKRTRGLLLIKQMKLPLLKSKHLRFCTEHMKSVFLLSQRFFQSISVKFAPIRESPTFCTILPRTQDYLIPSPSIFRKAGKQVSVQNSFSVGMH